MNRLEHRMLTPSEPLLADLPSKARDVREHIQESGKVTLHIKIDGESVPPIVKEISIYEGFCKLTESKV